jgi:hypothetical protein
MPERARGLIESALAGTPYLARALELLHEAAAGGSDECCAVWSEHGATVTALALVGLVAGARGAGRIHLLLGNDPQLVTRACDVLRAMGARLAVAEWPDDTSYAGALALLLASGFYEEGRIADYYRPGVDQRILRRDL